ncbi:helix-turn-helix domain-containing protein [Teichococcus vastitatis]
MPPSTLGRSSKSPSGRSLSFADREEIALWRAQGHGVREVARRLRRSRASYGAMLRRAAAGWSTGPRRRSGTPSRRRGVRSRRSW